MANRFTDTTKWEDDWFLNLSPDHKLVWFYVCDRCDHAGIWNPSQRMMDAFIGKHISLDSALVAFGGRVSLLQNSRWYICKFVRYQYKGALNPENKAHKSVIAILVANGIDSSTLEAPSIGAMVGAKDMDKDMVKDMVKVKDNSTSTTQKQNKDIYTPEFLAFWQAYPARKGKKAGKAEAFGEWKALKPDAELQAQMLKALAGYKDELPLDACRWIKRKRWEDEQAKPQDQKTFA